MLVYVYILISIYIYISIYATEPNKIKYEIVSTNDVKVPGLSIPPPTQILCWDLHHQKRSCRPTLKNPSAAVHFCRFCGPNHFRSHSCSMAGRRRYQKVKGHNTKDRQSHHHQNLGLWDGVPEKWPWIFLMEQLMESHGHVSISEASTKKSLNISQSTLDGST